MVNWDPKLQTAISDLEVEQQRDRRQSVALPLSAGGRARCSSSSSPPPARRPCWATAAVAVHPEDERYTDLIGKHCDPAAWSAAAFRSSATSMPTRSRAPAR
ncbi:MAG: hypothetical protein ACMVO3_16065 [Thalassobaculum sp.]